MDPFGRVGVGEVGCSSRGIPARPLPLRASTDRSNCRGYVSIRFFSGRESWVFRAASVDELCGFHADLVAQALRPHERLRYLLYSPLREAEGGPFGIADGSGSHALAVTDERVIITRDPHRPRFSRTVRSVSFSHIFAIELGEALTLGWLVLLFASDDRVASETVFFQSSGIHLFRTAVRLVRRNGTATGRIDPQTAEWERLLAPSPLFLRNQLVPMLLEDERPECVVHSDERWTASGRSTRCVSPHGVYAVTDRAMLITESERPGQPGTLVFAVRVVNVPRQVIRGARIISHDPSDARIARLVVQSEAQGIRHQIQLTSDEQGADEFVRTIATLDRCRPAP